MYKNMNQKFYVSILSINIIYFRVRKFGKFEFILRKIV